MELNRDQIIKALECHSSGKLTSCGVCPANICETRYNATCVQLLCENALALIKELTEEVTDLQEKVEAYRLELGETRVALAEANNDKRELAEENERLRERTKRYLENLKAVLDERSECNIASDTVREMRSRIEERCVAGGIYPAFVKAVVDKVAKELSGEDNT